MKYGIRFFRDEEFYSAMVPGLPGCVAAGDTMEQVRELISEAITLHLEDMRKSGQTLMPPTSRMAVDVSDMEDGEMYGWVNVRPPTTKSPRKQRAAG